MNQTLAIRLFPTRTLTRDIALILGATALTALGAKVSIPWLPVPFTLQTFFVLLTAFVLGSRRSVAAQMAYIGAGLCGLPVFAGPIAGPAYVFGPTGGYLLGFVAASWLVGSLAEKGWDKRTWSSVLAMTIGSIVILSIGTMWLGVLIGFEKALMVGVAPFLLSELAKVLVAGAMLPVAWKLVK